MTALEITDRFIEKVKGIQIVLQRGISRKYHGNVYERTTALRSTVVREATEVWPYYTTESGGDMVKE